MRAFCAQVPLSLLALLLLSAVALRAEESARAMPCRPGPASWQRVLEQYHRSGRIPGALLLVKSPAWGTRVTTVGVADYGSGEPMTVDSPFRIGQVSKLMTAAALLQMDHEWKVRLDQPLTDLLEGTIIPQADQITLQDCLRMTSGIADYRSLPEFALSGLGTDDARRYVPDEIVGKALESAQPGALGAYRFCDTDYILAGLVAEKIDGRPLDEILRERVFVPAGMTSSYFDQGREPPENMVRGYTGVGTDGGTLRDRTLRSSSSDWAAGAVVSTPRDMLVFLEKLFALEILPEHAFARMTKLVCDWDGNPVEAHGLGIMERVTRRGTVRGQRGRVPGYQCVVGRYLHGDAYVLLFVNTSDHEYIGQTVFDEVLRQVSGAANRMTPENGAKVTGTAVDLTWAAGLLYGQTYNVYVGTDEEQVFQATPEAHDGVRLFTVGKRDFRQQVGDLRSGSQYFWRVDTVRERPDYELRNERLWRESLQARYPDMEHYFIPEHETITGPVFSFSVE